MHRLYHFLAGRLRYVVFLARLSACPARCCPLIANCCCDDNAAPPLAAATCSRVYQSKAGSYAVKFEW